jgi:hypothetical protein
LLADCTLHRRRDLLRFHSHRVLPWRSSTVCT